MERVSLKRLAVVLYGNSSQCPRPPKIDSHRYEHHRESGDARFDLHMTEKHSSGRFVNDPDTSQKQEAGFDEGGKILYLAMTVLVVGIGWFIGNANRKESDNGSNKIEPGMSGLRQDAQTSP